jgi:hypothetical protein
MLMADEQLPADDNSTSTHSWLSAKWGNVSFKLTREESFYEKPN